MPAKRVIEDALCVGCGLLCDDIRLEIDGTTLEAARRACPIGVQWFERTIAASTPATLADGVSATFERAIARGGEILLAAKRPLVCGLAGGANGGQREAVALADRLGAFVDWTTHPADAAATIALQARGVSGATLGEVARRADLALCWRGDLVSTHPRLLERLGLERNQRGARRLIYLGAADQATALVADEVHSPREGSDLESLSVLRALQRGLEPDAEQVMRSTGVEVSQWRRLQEQISQARYVAILPGPELTQGGDATVEALHAFAHEAHRATRTVVLPLGRGDNAPGGENVLAWQTGFPLGVSLERGYPEYGPDEFLTPNLLERGEVDAALVVSAEGLAGLSLAAVSQLRQLPSVVLAAEEAAWLHPTVQLPIAPLGSATNDSLYRADGVALAFRQSLAPCTSQVDHVLRQLHQAIDRRGAAKT